MLCSWAFIRLLAATVKRESSLRRSNVLLGARKEQMRQKTRVVGNCSPRLWNVSTGVPIQAADAACKIQISVGAGVAANVGPFGAIAKRR
jgi:hypothetical protein